MLIVWGVVVSALAGCGDEKVDDEKVEDFIREHSQVPSLIRAVECPEDEEVEEGAVFECRIQTAGGGRETATIRQVEDSRVVWDGSRQVRLPEGQRRTIIPENVEELIRSRAPEPDEVASADCPPDVRLKKGGTFECVVQFIDGSATLVEVTQFDELGNVDITGSRTRKRP